VYPSAIFRNHVSNLPFEGRSKIKNTSLLMGDDSMDGGDRVTQEPKPRQGGGEKIKSPSPSPARGEGI